MESKKGKEPILIYGINTQRDKPIYTDKMLTKKEGLEGPPPPSRTKYAMQYLPISLKDSQVLLTFAQSQKVIRKPITEEIALISALSSYQQSLSVISLCNDHNYTFFEPIIGTLFAFNTRVCYLLKLLVILAIDGLSFTNASFWRKYFTFSF